VTDSTKAQLTALLKTREPAIARSDQKLVGRTLRQRDGRFPPQTGIGHR
jgi:hypothetical protein